MKRFILSIIFTFAFLAPSFGQEPAQYMYCELVGTGKMLSNKVTVELDFGQATKFFGASQRLRDENGQAIKFNSMVDAMNWMGKDGWEFVQAYVVTTSQQNVYHWLLKKDLSGFTDEEKSAIADGFKVTK